MKMHRDFRAFVQITRRQQTFVTSLVYDGIGRRGGSLNISLLIKIFSVVECCQIGVSDFCDMSVDAVLGNMYAICLVLSVVK